MNQATHQRGRALAYSTPPIATTPQTSFRLSAASLKLSSGSAWPRSIASTSPFSRKPVFQLSTSVEPPLLRFEVGDKGNALFP